jgi:hypothetical protein
MRHKTKFAATRVPTTIAGRRGVCQAAVAVLLLVGSANARAQENPEYRGTHEQQVACMADVFRLCWSEIPNVNRIVGCLVREKPRLSAGCRAVFEQSSRIASAHWYRNHRRLASARDRLQPASNDHPAEARAGNPLQVASASSPAASSVATPSSRNVPSKIVFRHSHAKTHIGRFHRSSQLVRHRFAIVAAKVYRHRYQHHRV